MGIEGPAADANAARNARRERGRRARWAPARDALWELLRGHLGPGMRVAIVGAGNGDDLPLGRIAAVAGSVTLLDIDARTAGRARSGVRRGLRRRVRVIEHDVTGGAADRIVREARRVPSAAVDPKAAGLGSTEPRASVAGGSGPRTGEPAVPAAPATPAALAAPATPATPPADGGTAAPPAPPADALPGGPYDLVVGDLLYSQLLYPALLDAEVPVERRRAVLGRDGAALTRAVVARLHASAPVVVHVHDLACWGNGYAQPVELGAIVGAATDDPAAALVLASGTKGPREADPRPALPALGAPVVATGLWRWPFTDGVDYLVVATVAGPPGHAA